MKISQMRTPDKGITSTFIAGDWHSGTLHKPSYNIMKKHAMELPPDMRNLIINGDFVDAAHLMERSPDFKKWIKRSDGIDEYFIPMSEEELAWANEILDDLQTVFNDIIFIYGNHDWRYDWFMSKVSPDYSHNFDLKRILKFSERKIDYVGYNDWLDWGSLSITHGMYHGTTCWKKHYEAGGSRNCIFSHVHSHDIKSFIVRGKTKHSISLPAFCELNPHYIKNRETNWSNGYGQILMRPDGDFNFYCHQIWDGKLVLPTGQILEG